MKKHKRIHNNKLFDKIILDHQFLEKIITEIPRILLIFKFPAKNKKKKI